MFQLFKIRDFGSYISDSFTFLKLQGKNYFKNYLKFAFLPLVLLMASMSLIGTFYYRLIATSLGDTSGETLNNSFVNNNAVLLVVGLIALVVVGLYLALVNYSYPVYYMQILSKNSEQKPELRSIRALFKADFSRLLLFGFLSLIVFSLIGIIALIIAGILMFVIIGFFLFLLIIPFFITWYSLTLYFYIDKKQPFFDTFKHGFYTITNNFWNIVGASLCMLIIVQVLGTIVTMIPYFIMIFGVVFGIQTQGPENYDPSNMSFVGILTIIIYCFSILVSTILNHLLLIQNGLVYYSEREKLEYNTMHQSIDDIGKYE